MIVIRKSETADSRTATELVTKEQLFRSSEQHIQDVMHAMAFFAAKLRARGILHDHTKVDAAGIEQFHKDFEFAQTTGGDFTNRPWYQRHISEERHHLNDRCPEDVNLFDVMEMIGDCVMAGLGRSGSYKPIVISSDILQKAVANTADMLVKEVEVRG